MSGENDISWALKLLEREQGDEPNFLAKHWARICAPLFGIAVPTALNVWLKRPPWAGVHRHVVGGCIGFGVGHLMMKRERYVLARRDAMFRDYIRLHPEDFPPPERKKWADVFERWVPIR